MSAEDHLGQQFWRAHPNDRSFSPEDATSREWGDSRSEPDRGYSAFEKPEHLIGYFHPSERDEYSSHVINFTGHKVGEGMEGEPLVVPDMRHVKRMEWDDLAHHVGQHVVDDSDRRNGWINERPER